MRTSFRHIVIFGWIWVRCYRRWGMHMHVLIPHIACSCKLKTTYRVFLFFFFELLLCCCNKNFLNVFVVISDAHDGWSAYCFFLFIDFGWKKIVQWARECNVYQWKHCRCSNSILLRRIGRKYEENEREKERER